MTGQADLTAQKQNPKQNISKWNPTTFLKKIYPNNA